MLLRENVRPWAHGTERKKEGTPAADQFEQASALVIFSLSFFQDILCLQER